MLPGPWQAAAAQMAARLATVRGMTPAAEPEYGPQPEAEHYRRLVIMLLKRTYYGEAIFSEEERASAAAYVITEGLEDGKVVVRAVLRAG